MSNQHTWLELLIQLQELRFVKTGESSPDESSHMCCDLRQVLRNTEIQQVLFRKPDGRYLPKGTNLSTFSQDDLDQDDLDQDDLDQDDLDAIADKLNNRPRKVHGFLSPMEVP